MFRFLNFVVVCCLAASTVSGTPSEDLIDEMIYEINQEMTDKHQETMTIPNIDEKFDKKVAFFKVKGEFTGEGGWFRNISSIKRVGPLEMDQTDDKIVLGIALGLDDLAFGFEKYRIEVLNIGLHGKMSVSVSKNSIYGHLTMHFPANATCHTTVDKLEVQVIDGFHVELSGHSHPLDWAYSLVAQFLAHSYHKKIATALTTKLNEVVGQVLAKNDICTRFQP